MLEVFELSYQLIEAFREPVKVLQRKDPDLARQLRKAGSSVSLNLAEGEGRVVKDRFQHWRISSGSAREVKSALRAALAWGYLTKKQIERPQSIADRVLAMTWNLMR